MNIASLNKPRLIKAAITAFFVLIAIGFTLEPLVSLIIRTQDLPAGTGFSLAVAPGKNKRADFYEEIVKITGKTPSWGDNLELLDKTKDLIFGLKIKSALIGNDYVVINANTPAVSIIAEIKRYLAKLTPFEIKTLLPDKTAMIEIVIDPALIKTNETQDNGQRSWVFEQTNPHIVIQEIGQNSVVILSNQQPVETHGLLGVKSCSLTGNGTKTIAYGNDRQTLTKAVVSSFSAYFRDFSCFQSFSTLSPR
jgi:hypothetical protein